jgi:hypothetical protein
MSYRLVALSIFPPSFYVFFFLSFFPLYVLMLRNSIRWSIVHFVGKLFQAGILESVAISISRFEKCSISYQSFIYFIIICLFILKQWRCVDCCAFFVFRPLARLIFFKQRIV